MINMIYEDDLFIIYYNECDKSYLELLVNTVRKKIPSICSFFKIKYDKKIVIKLYNNLEDYKSNLKESFKKEALIQSKKEKKYVAPREYKNWMIANTEDGNINMQSLDLVKEQDDYRDYNEEKFCYNASHEFTHLCQNYLNSDNPGWFWELVATILGNPEVQHENNNTFTINDLEDFDNIDGYGLVYTFGKYLFENYDQDTILDWIKNNKKFLEEIPDIILEYNSLKRK